MWSIYIGLHSFLKKEALDLLFPHSCAGCGTESEIFCGACRAKVRMITPQCFVCGAFSPGRGRVPAGRTCKTCRKSTKIYGFVSPFSYGDPAVKELIHYLKYRRVKGAADILAAWFSEYAQNFKIKLPREFIIIPVPLHKYRERTRGFNQARLIAEKLSFPGLKFCVSSGPLERKKDTKPQVDLARNEREENVRSAFTATKPELLKDKIVLLLDDVKTTGATLEEAARTLKKAGAKRVWAITIAH